MAPPNVFTEAVARVEQIGRQAGVPSEVIVALEHPRATLTASLPVRMDDGSTSYFVAYRCQYNNVLGPTKGGIGRRERGPAAGRGVLDDGQLARGRGRRRRAALRDPAVRGNPSPSRFTPVMRTNSVCSIPSSPPMALAANTMPPPETAEKVALARRLTRSQRAGSVGRWVIA